MPAISYALNYYLILGLLSDLSGNNLDEIPRVGTPKTLARALLGGPLDWCPDSSTYWRHCHHRIIPSLTEYPPETSRLVFGTGAHTTRRSPPHLTFSNNFVNNYRRLWPAHRLLRKQFKPSGMSRIEAILYLTSSVSNSFTAYTDLLIQ